jgi:hypothetical protein
VGTGAETLLFSSARRFVSPLAVCVSPVLSPPLYLFAHLWRVGRYRSCVYCVCVHVSNLLLVEGRRLGRTVRCRPNMLGAVLLLDWEAERLLWRDRSSGAVAWRERMPTTSSSRDSRRAASRGRGGGGGRREEEGQWR